jgi:YHS domain-containing protein
MSSLMKLIPSAIALAAGLMAQEPIGAPLRIVPPGPKPERSSASPQRTYQRRKVDAFSHDHEQVAIPGYDLVSYLDRKPQRGRAEFTVEYGGVVWQFATADNREAFQHDPQRYLPQYGGFCAFAVSIGLPAHADPRIFAVVEGKLYLFFDSAVRLVWEQDRDRAVADANARWPELHR